MGSDNNLKLVGIFGIAYFIFGFNTLQVDQMGTNAFLSFICLGVCSLMYYSKESEYWHKNYRLSIYFVLLSIIASWVYILTDSSDGFLLPVIYGITLLFYVFYEKVPFKTTVVVLFGLAQILIVIDTAGDMSGLTETARETNEMAIGLLKLILPIFFVGIGYAIHQYGKKLAERKALSMALAQLFYAYGLMLFHTSTNWYHFTLL